MVSPSSSSKPANLIRNCSPQNSKCVNLIQVWAGPCGHTLYNAQTVFCAFPITANGPLLLRVQQHTSCRWLNHRQTLNPLWLQWVKWCCLDTFKLTYLLSSLLTWRWCCDLDRLMVWSVALKQERDSTPLSLVCSSGQGGCLGLSKGSFGSLSV